MIELFAADTPNGKKISIMLEEINFKYKVKKINLLQNEQFVWFLSIRAVIWKRFVPE